MAIGFPVKDDYVTGDVLTAANMNDLSGTVNLLDSVQYAAGKNKIINGDFGVWQRGTSFTNPAAFSYLVDRWRWGTDGTGSTTVFSRQTFTPGTAPVTGYEGVYFLRWDRSVATTGATYDDFYQPIENVQTGANQTVTMSFWAKAAAAKTLTLVLSQNFGSGGSAQISTTAGTANVTTAWQRFTLTVALPSISGKTIGTGSSLGFVFQAPFNTTFTFDIWGVQLEQSSVASDFQTATGTIQGELAACQRYYFRATGQTTSFYTMTNMGFARNTTIAYIPFQIPVTMRKMTSLDYANIRAVRASTDIGYNTGTFTFTGNNTLNIAELAYTHGTGVFTQGENVYLGNNNSASAYIAINGEL